MASRGNWRNATRLGHEGDIIFGRTPSRYVNILPYICMDIKINRGYVPEFSNSSHPGLLGSKEGGGRAFGPRCKGGVTPFGLENMNRATQRQFGARDSSGLELNVRVHCEWSVLARWRLAAGLGGYHVKPILPFFKISNRRNHGSHPVLSVSRHDCCFCDSSSVAVSCFSINLTEYRVSLFNCSLFVDRYRYRYIYLRLSLA